MNQTVEAEIGKFPHVTTPAKGGMFQWIELPGVNTQALLPKAIEAGVAFVPEAAFFADGAGSDCLRPSFASAGTEKITDGVRRQVRAIATLR